MLYSAGKIVNWLRVKNNAYMHLNPNEDEIINYIYEKYAEECKYL